MSALDLKLTIAIFPTAFPKGPAYGRLIEPTWHDFTGMLQVRRQGMKDGSSFIPATFILEPDGSVRRVWPDVRPLAVHPEAGHA